MIKAKPNHPNRHISKKASKKPRSNAYAKNKKKSKKFYKNKFKKKKKIRKRSKLDTYGRRFKFSAEHFGYLPWIQFTYWEWIEINKFVKKETLEMLRVKLVDPRHASPNWLLQFALACEKIGLALCAKQADLYAFVKKQPAYKTLDVDSRAKYVQNCKTTFKVCSKVFSEQDINVIKRSFKILIRNKMMNDFHKARRAEIKAIKAKKAKKIIEAKNNGSKRIENLD